MSKNLFIALNQDIISSKDKDIKIKIKRELYLFKEGSQTLIDHFFYYNISEESSKEEKEIYYAKDVLVRKIKSNKNGKNNDGELSCEVEFSNGNFELVFKEPLLKKPFDILKDVYAKSNRKMMGDTAFSIYHTFKVGKFPYALPVIDKKTFMVKDEFVDMLLCDSYIIPNDLEQEKPKTFAKIVKEDDELFLTLTNKKMIQVDYQYLLEQKHRDIYRPYFYEFMLSDTAQQNLKKELEEKPSNILKMHYMKLNLLG